MNSSSADKKLPAEPKTPKPEPKPVAASLREYFASDETPPNKFISQTLRKPPTPITTTDREELASEVAKSPAKLLRLLQAFTSLPNAQSVIADQLANLAEQICRTTAPTEVSIPRLYPALEQEQLKRCAAAMASRGAKEKKAERERITYLWLAAAWVKCSLSGPALGEILLLLKRDPVAGLSEADTELAKIFVRSLGKNAVLAEVLSTYALQRNRLLAAHEIEERLTETNRRLTEELNSERNRVRDLEQEVARLVATTAQVNEQCKILSRDLEDQQAVARQSRRALRSRFNGLLQGDISALVRDAQDAAAPPIRAHVILDRLETLGTLIKKETKWLESSE